MAAQGDILSYGAYNVASNGTTDIQPGSGVEVIITEVESEAGKSMEVYRTSDGTNFVKLDTYSGGSVQVALVASNTFWLRLKNVSGGTAGNFAAGKQTKPL